MGIGDLLVPFHQIEGLAFDVVLTPELIDENVRKIAIFEVSGGYLDVVLSSGIIFER